MGAVQASFKVKIRKRRAVHSRVAFAFAASLSTPVVVIGHNCPAGEPAAATHISIPAQPLNGALQALAAQTGLDILFEPSAVAGLNATAVSGEMRPGDALCLLLGDRGLAYSINADHKIIISRRAQTMVVPLKDPVAAAEPVPDVIVTGTRRLNESAASSLAPIAVISGTTLNETGSTDTAETLSQLLPSFNYPQPALTDGTDIVRPATLRGLQPDEMLVLVNGKRRHTSALLNINTTVGRGAAGVDLSLLPAAAIERVEVLSDDAAAQYGSDAIAGVVNVLLKQQREGTNVTVMYGQSYTTIHGVPEAVGVQTQPDGQPVTVPSTGQQSVYALRYRGDREAHDGETVLLSGNVGLPLGTEGYLDIAGQGRDQSPTNRAGYNPQQQYPLTADGLADPRELTFDRLSQRFGEPRIEDAEIVANAGVPLGDSGAEWYAFGTYGARYGLTTGFYRPALDPDTLTDIYPNGFLPLIKVDVNDESLVSGVRGDFGRWNYDLSANFGRDVMNFETENSDDAQLGDSSPTRFQAGGLRYQELLFNLGLQRDLTLVPLTRPLSVAWGLEYRDERFAIVAGAPFSYTDPEVSFGNNNPTVNSGQAFPGFGPTNVLNQGRHSSSAYIDLEQDLTSRWTLAVAGRAERYSDFGSTLNYKVASRVSLLPGFALRGSMSTGFKAPSLQQLYFSTTSTNDVNGKLVNVGTLAVTDAAAAALGATALKPERSRNLRAGMVFDGVEGLDIAVDWYRIAINDRIVLTDNLGVEGTETSDGPNSAVQAILANQGFPALSGARFFINGVDTLTQGVDVVSSYRVSLQRRGNLRFTAGFSANQTRITRYLDNLDANPQDPLAGVTLFGPTGSELLTRGQPRTKLNLSAEWSRHEWSTTVRTNRYGSVLSPGADTADDLLIQPAWVTDVELRYTLAAWGFALGAQNVLDQYPTAEPTGSRPKSLGGYYDVNNYLVPFSVLSPFGFSGRFLYGRMSYKF